MADDTQLAGQMTPGQNPPTMLGDPSQQQPPAPQQQPPPQQGPSQPSPLQSETQATTAALLKQTADRIQQLNPPPASGGPIRQLLQNFFHGAGNAMMTHVGMPTPQQQQHQLMQQYTTLATAQSADQMRQAQEQHTAALVQNWQRSPVTAEEAQLAGVTPGTMMTPAEKVSAMVGNSKAAIAPTIHKEVVLGSAQIKAGAQNQNPSAAARDNRFLNLMGADRTTWNQDDKQFVKGYLELTDVNKVQPRVKGYQALASSRAATTPFETTVPGTNIPKTISNLEAINTGAPKVPLGTQIKLGGQYAVYNDMYGILNQVDKLADTVNMSDPAVRARLTAGYSALKDPAGQGLPMEVLSNFLARQPVNAQLKPNERQLLLLMSQGKAASLGTRGIMGQAGVNEMQQRFDSTMMPGGQALGSKEAFKQQTGAMRSLLGRFQVGQPQVGLNAPGTSSALSNQAGGGGNKIPVVELSTGRNGMLPESEFDPAKYRKR